jgi:hypothetical protein
MSAKDFAYQITMNDVQVSTDLSSLDSVKTDFLEAMHGEEEDARGIAATRALKGSKVLFRKNDYSKILNLASATGGKFARAIESHNIAGMASLLNKGMSPNLLIDLLEDAQSYGPALWIAVYSKNIDAVRILLNRSDVKANDEGFHYGTGWETPLFMATYLYASEKDQAYLEIARMLTSSEDSGVNEYSPSDYQFTPLMYVAYYGGEEMAKVLVNAKGLDCSIKAKDPAMTALEIAEWDDHGTHKTHPEVARVIMSAPACQSGSR